MKRIAHKAKWMMVAAGASLLGCLYAPWIRPVLALVGIERKQYMSRPNFRG